MPGYLFLRKVPDLPGWSSASAFTALFLSLMFVASNPGKDSLLYNVGIFRADTDNSHWVTARVTLSAEFEHNVICSLGEITEGKCRINKKEKHWGHEQKQCLLSPM